MTHTGYTTDDYARPARVSWPGRERVLVLLAFGVLYLVWGSTFLAIRVAVLASPPFLVAALRFASAGIILLAWQLAAGQPFPSHAEWLRGALLGGLMFLIPYSALFWSEQHIASGVAAVILAIIPIFTLGLEIWPFRLRVLRKQIAFGTALGFVGVMLLMLSRPMPGAAFNRTAALVLCAAAFSWSVGSLVAKRIQLPKSKAVSASIQMLTGGTFLAVLSLASGEAHGFRFGQVPLRAWLALAYLTAFGSILAFTAYVWLLGRVTPSIVSTYAFVNPVVAVVLGWIFLGERLSAVQIAASGVIVIATALVLKPEQSSLTLTKKCSSAV
jgi:drug/metabolite transporter (DMT)-like permease